MSIQLENTWSWSSLSWVCNLSPSKGNYKNMLGDLVTLFFLCPAVRKAMSQWQPKGPIFPHCDVARLGVSISIESRSPSLGPPPHFLVLAAAFSGRPQAVIMTGPLKREGMLASTVSQSNVVITPAPIARVRAWTDLSILKPAAWPALGWPLPNITVVRNNPSLFCHPRLLESQSSTAASW